jgi:hypothetical protein
MADDIGQPEVTGIPLFFGLQTTVGALGEASMNAFSFRLIHVVLCEFAPGERLFVQGYGNGKGSEKLSFQS